MSIQYEPSSDPNWEHLRAVLAQSRVEEAPKRRNYWSIVEIAALTIFAIGMGVFVKIEAADIPDGAITGAVVQFEEQITRLEQRALAAVHIRVVNAQPATKPTPKVAKPKKISMVEPADGEQSVAGNRIKVEESIKELPKFQVEIVDHTHRRVVNADDKHMIVEIAQPGAMSAAGDQPLPVRLEPVVLRARINRDGAIDNLTRVSGPSDLTTAAIETVKGLHYQPTYRNGAPVETETEITVNFVPSR